MVAELGGSDRKAAAAHLISQNDSTISAWVQTSPFRREEVWGGVVVPEHVDEVGAAVQLVVARGHPATAADAPMGRLHRIPLPPPLRVCIRVRVLCRSMHEQNSEQATCLSCLDHALLWRDKSYNVDILSNCKFCACHSPLRPEHLLAISSNEQLVSRKNNDGGRDKVSLECSPRRFACKM